MSRFFILVALVLIEFANCAQTDPAFLNCGFDKENDYCNYSPKDSSSWDFVQATQKFTKPSKLSNGPVTPVDNKGGYIKLIGAEDALKITDLELRGQFCVEFYYYTFGDVGTVSVDFIQELASGDADYRSPKEAAMSWSRGHLHLNADKWHHFQNTLDTDDKPVIAVVFRAHSDEVSEGKYEFRPESSVALDNIKVTAGECQRKTSLYCDFDTSKEGTVDCDWFTQPNSPKGFSWLSRRPYDESNRLSPQLDQSSRTKKGKFLEADFKSGKDGEAEQGETLTLTSKMFPNDMGKQCFAFWYYQNGDELAVSLIENHGSQKTLWTSVPTRRDWQLVKVDIESTNAFQIAFVATKSTLNSNPIDIDSIRLLPGECPQPLDCAFRDHLCGWQNSGPQDKHWRLGYGRVFDPSAIAIDFTLPNESPDMFLYLDGSFDEGTVSAIESPLFIADSKSSKFCIRLSVYKKGAIKTNDVYISVRQESVADRWKKIIEFTDEDFEDGEWHEVARTFDMTGRSTLVLQSSNNVKGKFFLGVRDLSVEEGACGLDTNLLDPTISGQFDSCNFDDATFCSWQTSNLPGFWRHSESQTYKINSRLPKFDHTQQNSEGKYIYVSSIGGGSDPDATLSLDIASKVFKTGMYCFSFWYVLVGGKSSKINLKYTGDGRLPMLEQDAVTKSEEWNYYETSLLHTVGEKQGIEIIAPVLSESAVAIDDIEFHEGSCSHHQRNKKVMFACTFENFIMNRCELSMDLTPAGENSLMWRYTKDDNDHTYKGAVSGTTMALELKPSPAGRTRFTTPKFHPRESACVSFWIKHESNDESGFRALLIKGDADEDDDEDFDIMMSSRNYDMKFWRGYSYQVDFLGPWSVAFEAKYTHAQYKKGFMSVDDIRIERGHCHPKTSCDFESGACLWTSAKINLPKLQSTLEWARHAAIDHSTGYYPKKDVNDEHGHYLLMSGQSGKGSLISPELEFPANADHACLTFWAWFPVDGDKQIEVFSTSSLSQLHSETTVLFHGNSKPTEAKWTQHRVQIDRVTMVTNRQLWIILVGSFTGESKYIAIDDLSLQFEKCPANLVADQNLQCTDGKRLTEDQICDWIKDCEDGSDEKNCGHDCTMSHESLCQWKEMKDDPQVSWQFTSDRSRDPSKILTAKFGQVTSNWIALKSPELKPTQLTCKLRVSTRGFLTIFKVLISELGQEEVEVWNSGLLPDSHEHWVSREIPIGQINRNFETAFHVESKGVFPQLAIESFAFVDCGPLEFVSVPKEECNGFSCKNGNCISHYKICNGQNDCGDNSDENDGDICDETFKCNFGAYCFFDKVSGWDRSDAKDTLLIGPTRDHTLNSHKGHFLLKSGSKPEQLNPNGNRASLSTNFIPSKCATFYYMSKGGNNKVLVNGDSTKVTINGPVGQWNQVYLDKINQKEFRIEVTVNGQGNYLAIDDFYFGANCQGHKAMVTSKPDLVADGTDSDVDQDSEPTEEPRKPIIDDKRSSIFNCVKTGHHIPMYLVCDGVNDCGDNEDEDDKICQGVKCDSRGIFCLSIKDKTGRSCLTDRSKFCDGKFDCRDGSDEDPKICHRGGWCPGFCRNGQCRKRAQNDQLESCFCSDKQTFGKRCQYSSASQIMQSLPRKATTPPTLMMTEPSEEVTEDPDRPFHPDDTPGGMITVSVITLVFVFTGLGLIAWKCLARRRTDAYKEFGNDTSVQNDNDSSITNENL